MLKTKVKASSITNLTDARYFSAWEVNYIGFNLEEGNGNFIAPINVKAMKEWIQGPAIVGEFGSYPELNTITEMVKSLSLDMVQVGHFCNLEIVQALHKKGIPVIKEFIWNETSNSKTLQQTYELFSPYVDMFLLDFSINNNAIDQHIDDIREMVNLHPSLLDTNLTASSLESFLADLQPLGIALKGGDEEKVGFKSFDDVDEIFETLEIFV